MTRKYKRAAKRRNKTAVQKYRTRLNWYGCRPVDDDCLCPSQTGPTFWQRVAQKLRAYWRSL